MKRVRILVPALVSALAIGVFGVLQLNGLEPAGAASTVEPQNLQLTITRPGGQPLEQMLKFTPFELHARFGLPADVQSKDEFKIEFPPEIEAYTPAPDFYMRSPQFEVIGTCKVAKSAVTCTLDTWVDTHTNFDDFTMFVGMYAQESTSKSELPFTVNGKTTINVGLPPGGIKPVSPTPFPKGPEKNGWLNRENPGQVVWRIWLDVRGLTTLLIEDTFGDHMTLVAGSQKAKYWTVQPQDWNSADPFAAGTAGPKDLPGAFTPESDGTGITFSAAVPNDATVVALTYVTQLPPGIEFGDVVHNSVDGSLGKFESKVQYNYRAEATGNGNELPDIVIEKKVTGNAPADAKFKVSVSCTKNDVPLPNSPYTRTFSVTDPALILDLPIGTRCVVAEIDDGHAISVAYLPADGVVVIGTDKLVTITITNGFAHVPSPEEATPTNLPTRSVTPSALTPPPIGSGDSGTAQANTDAIPDDPNGSGESGDSENGRGLAQTGAGMIAAFFGGLFLLFGAGTLVARRRS